MKASWTLSAGLGNPAIPTITCGAEVENFVGEVTTNNLVKFINENGGKDNPDGYATFEYDLSAYNGKNVVLALGVVKGADNTGNEEKLCIHSIVLK